jgi:MFS family permease
VVTEPAEPAIAPSRARLGLLAIALAVLAPAMDTSVNIALPAVSQAFDLAQRDIQWIVTCYMLVNGALMLTCGKLGDLYGHRRVLQSGLALTAVAFAACTVATSYPALLGARALQGAGIALTWSCAPALVTALYPESRRTWVLGTYGAITALGGALGPLLGSWLVSAFGWSGVFAFRVPLALAALALSFALPRSATAPHASKSREARFDRLGAGLLVVWMSALMLACAGPFDLTAMGLAPPDWVPDGPRLGWVLAAVGACGLALFVWHESRTPEPIIRPGLFRSPPFALLNALCLIVNMASFAVLLVVPYVLRTVLHFSIEVSGLLLAICGIGTMAGSWVTGRLGRHLPVPRSALAGALLAGVGLLLIGQWTSGLQPWVVAATLFVQGFGLGLFQVAYNDSVIATLPPEDRGVAGSLTMMVRTLGILGGATGLSALLQTFTTQALDGGAGPQLAFRIGFQQTLTAAGLLVLGSVALLLLLRPRVWR